VSVLVTGGTGFLGVNIVEELLRERHEVVVFSDVEMQAHARDVLASLPGKLTVACGDIADDAAVDQCFAEHRPERVIHAAVITSGEQRELRELDRVIDVNIKGTGHVLRSASRHGAARVVYVSSGSAYGTALFGAAMVSEATPPQPDTLYAITKHACERLCARYRQMRGLDAVCARLGSVFGPWEHDTGVRDTLSLPFQILAHARANEEVVLSRREARRDWIYSRDAAAGLVRLLCANTLHHDLYNLAGGRQWPQFAEEWCARLQQVCPALRYRIAGERDKPNVSFLGERDRAMMSIDRIVADADFRPVFDQRAAFADFIAWLRGNLGHDGLPEGSLQWRK
jgi:nucleoside-diphosphate-sugar epimerase